MKMIRVVAAVIADDLDHPTKILATERGYGEFKGQWEFPGGKIEVGPLLGTIEYDYPNFHLSMDTFLAKVRKGTIILKEAEAAKWLTKGSLDTVGWLPADQTIIEKIHEIME